jgi:hypothetical protein
MVRLKGAGQVGDVRVTCNIVDEQMTVLASVRAAFLFLNQMKEKHNVWD